ncbi:MULTISPECIES: PilZ domain-containing protein [Acidobacteriaceae]|uniref:PilZ domain-containing protein n=1 Tax=Acidobacteriaceae TaxID=204434 RepID=UPI00131CAD6C|nr:MULTISPECIES: PilZ domain-containing protein [Acidobacteriaceae]MDW5265031.1 PilZ domain-containing protein [Edaphobacter sp.]
MTNTKKSKGSIPPETPGEASLPTMMLAFNATESIGRRKKRRETDDNQSIADFTEYSKLHPNERRKATRYLFDSAATIRWLGVDGQIHQAFGIVRDISISGVFVESTARLGLNVNIELEIAMPGSQPHSSGPDLKFEGNVVRSVNQEDQQGFAVAGSLYIPRLADS